MLKYVLNTLYYIYVISFNGYKNIFFNVLIYNQPIKLDYINKKINRVTNNEVKE